MMELTDQNEQLIADLLDEAHGLRMKYEEFSRYTEAKVAEFVAARRELTGERDRMAHLLSLAENDMVVLRARQEQLHRQLIDATTRLHEAQQRLVRRTQQRDRARQRVKALEASRAVRIARRVRRLIRLGR